MEHTNTAATATRYVYVRSLDSHRPHDPVVMSRRTRHAERLTPAVRDYVMFHTPFGTWNVGRVNRIRRNRAGTIRYGITEIVRSSQSIPFAAVRWIESADIDSFVRVASAEPTTNVATDARPRPAVESVPMPAVTGKLTHDGYVEYTCDVCRRRSWRRPNRSQTTCRRCTNPANVYQPTV